MSKGISIDYHKHYSTVCVLDADADVVLETTIKPNSPEAFAAAFARLEAPVKAVFECGLNWGYLFDLLESLPSVSEVVPANAYRVRIIAEAQIKTDKLDAQKLDWLLRADLVPGVTRCLRRKRELALPGSSRQGNRKGV